jgi:hypothetical protein
VVDTACPNQFHLTWDAVPGATDYTVYQLGNKYMDSVGNSLTNDIYLTTGVNTVSSFYFAVRANIATNGAQGRRSIAYFKGPGQINCGDDLVNLRTEMPFYSANDCAPLNGVPVTMTIRNQSLTGAQISNIPVSFDINGITQVNEVIPGPLLVGDSINYTFTATASFPGAGIYNVRTRCSYQFDGFNQNDTSSRNMTVIAVPLIVPPLVQDFEGSYVPLNWRVQNPDNSIPWQKTFVLSGSTFGNSHAAYMDFYNYGAVGEQDILESPVVDLTNVTNDSVVLSFDVSYSQRSGSEDRLQLLMSEDCGQTWLATGYDKGGSLLATTVSSTGIFSPTIPGEWRNERIDLTPHKGKELLFRWIGINDNGNNLYLDNINVMLKDIPLGLYNLENSKYAIYPNPSDGKYVLKTQLNKSTQLMYAIKDLNGKVITKSKLGLHAGVTHSAIDITYLSSGVYMLELFDGSKSDFIKLIKN